MRLKSQSDQKTIVIFGGTGDLAMRKLLPGLYNIAYHSAGVFDMKIVAVGRHDHSRESYQNIVEESIKKYSRVPFEKSFCKTLKENLTYHQMDMSQVGEYGGLRKALNDIDNDGNRLYYLATSARFFDLITGFLAENNMHESLSGWRRVVIEKPFGSDLNTAKALNQSIKKRFDESKIYRIDHYLGKEMTQNILMLRGKNAVFNAVWNNNFIDHIQITVSEDMGVENRAAYYDHSGAMRDMIQNHLLQIVALTTMRFCDITDTEAIRDAKVNIFKALKPYSHEALHNSVILGQYEGYKTIPGITEESPTETFVAMKVEIDLPEWEGVPIYLRTGKKLAKKEAYMMIEFKKGKLCHAEGNEKPNRLVLKIQPEEGVSFHFNVKEPGNTMHVNEVEMDFCQTCQMTYNSPEAYESLLLDAIEGDQSRFTRWDEVESAWEFVDQIIKHCEDRAQWLESYEVNSWGPQSSNKLLENDGRAWWYIK